MTGAVITVDCGATAVGLPTIAFDLPGAPPAGLTR
jgi:hypothetical protein